jgi:glycosyltransferase involved in cell wall biosynthesis
MLVPEMVARKNSLVKRFWLRFIERHNLEQAAGLHVTSRLEIEDARRFGYHLPPCHLVPNGLESDDSTGELSPLIRGICGSGPYLLFLGRVNWKKGLDRLIRALPQVTGAPLVIAGNDEEGYRSTLETLAREVGVTERIIFTGPVAGADKQALLANASVMAAPSYSENFGNVVIEAWSVGCPVVVTPEVGLAEVVAETGTGLVVDGDPALLAGALSRFLHEADLRETMGQRGQRLVAARYTWDAVAEQMEAVYRGILSGKPGYRQ